MRGKRTIPRLADLRRDFGRLIEFRSAGDYNWDVFISYSSRDNEKATLIADTLTQHGLRVWFDRSAIPPGDRLREAVSDGIRNSAMLLLLFSAHSKSSKWVLNELDSAMLREIEERKTVVIPVLLGAVHASELPDDLKGKRYIDLRHRFTDRLRLELDTMLAVISASTFGSSKPLDHEILVGPNSLRYFLDYEYTGTALSTKLPYEAFAVLAEGVVHSLLSNKGAAKETMAFLNEYGMAVARKIVLFVFDHIHVDLTGGVGKEELNSAMSATASVMTIHNMQRVLDKLKIYRFALGYAGKEITFRIVKLQAADFAAGGKKRGRKKAPHEGRSSNDRRPHRRTAARNTRSKRRHKPQRDRGG